MTCEGNVRIYDHFCCFISGLPPKCWYDWDIGHITISVFPHNNLCLAVNITNHSNRAYNHVEQVESGPLKSAFLWMNKLAIQLYYLPVIQWSECLLIIVFWQQVREYTDLILMGWWWPYLHGYDLVGGHSQARSLRIWPELLQTPFFKQEINACWTIFTVVGWFLLL